MPLQEVIVCATAPSSSSAGPGAISLHDIRTSTNLASFKQSNAAVHCTAIVETSNAQGGFMLASQHEKSILNVYSFQKVPTYSNKASTGILSDCIIIGSNHSEDSFARKTLLHCRRCLGRILCGWYFTRPNISLGGKPFVCVAMILQLTLIQVTSGILYNSWDAHYRQVTVLRFTADGAAIVSGSEDSSVSVWPVSRSIWPRFHKI